MGPIPPGFMDLRVMVGLSGKNSSPLAGREIPLEGFAGGMDRKREIDG